MVCKPHWISNTTPPPTPPSQPRLPPKPLNQLSTICGQPHLSQSHLLTARGDYTEALNTCKDVLARLNIDQAKPELHAKTLQFLGVLHALHRQYDDARSNFNNALAIVKTLNQWGEVIIILTQLAFFSTLQNEGDREEPRTFLNEAKSLLIHIPSPLARRSLLAANTLVSLVSLDRQEQLSRDVLDETMEAALTIALEADEQRFTLDHTDERQQWINNTADSYIEMSFVVATLLNNAGLIAELVAKWRLSGTIEGRASETRILVPPPTLHQRLGDRRRQRPDTPHKRRQSWPWRTQLCC